MNPKPVALPRPRRTEGAVAAAMAVNADPRVQLRDLMQRRETLAYELGLVEAEVERFAIESICGDRDDTQDVETYDGTLGVTREFVEAHERPVGQLQWLDDLSTRFTGPGDSPGDVTGARWGSGGLYEEDLFITAGHCFDQNGGGWRRPRRNGTIVPPGEIAQLMRVNFNYQVDGSTGAVRAGVSFPVAELVEYRPHGRDVAIVRLGRGPGGELAGEMFGTLKLASRDVVARGAMLCLIQHPSGRPKQIEAGPLFENIGGQISYDSLDTEGGSSGAPLLSEEGEIVGVHTNGGCSRFSGANFGVAIEAIRAASAVL